MKHRHGLLLLLVVIGVALAACGTDGNGDLFGSPTADGGSGTPSPVGEGGTTAEPPPSSTVDAGEDADAAPPVYGFETRPLNATCKAFTRPPTTGVVRLVDRFPNVPLTTPTGMFQRPGDNTRWYVTERRGRVMYFPNDPLATDADTHVALDLHTVTWEQVDCSMSSIAFPADFATSKHAYVSYCYSGPETSDQLQVRVSRFATEDGGSTFDPASEQVIAALDFQYDGAHTEVGLHGGDALRFGTDGYLYWSVGDGGPQGSGGGHQAQDTSDLRGKLLRMDVHDLTKELPKTGFVAGRQRLAVDIPADNPFAGSAVYAYGFRNPWQWHFDRKDGKIWLGDVGYGDFEEIDRDVKSGGNYGWGVYEGFTCTGFFADPACDDATLIKPLLDYPHGDGVQDGNAVTGGVVYRGTNVPSLTGAYLFGDSSKGNIWAVRDVDGIPAIPAGTVAKDVLFDGAFVSSFAEDQDGEVYLTTLFGASQGRILALEEAPADPAPQLGGPPQNLSDTGCFEKADPQKPVAGLVPFAPTALLWSDGATKRRWFALPDGKTITVGADGDFDFPAGTVLVKEFSLGGRRVETRFFVRQDADSQWAGYTYQWNDAQTDATLVGPASIQEDVDRQTWTFPSRAQCHQCHTKVAGTSLGLELAQLNKDFAYPSGKTANQLATLEHTGFFSAALPKTLPSLAALDDQTKSVEARARSYLHVNCSNCHRPEGPTFTPPDFRFTTPLAQMNVCNIHPTIDDLADFIDEDPRILSPGDPERSVMYWRMETTDEGVRMPPLGRSITHDAAVDTLAAWITSVKTCP